MHPTTDDRSVPMLTADDVLQRLNAMLTLAKELLLASAKDYNERLPEDAHAWATLLAAGRVTPAMMIDFGLAGAHVALGYCEVGGKFHPFASWPLQVETPPAAMN